MNDLKVVSRVQDAEQTQVDQKLFLETAKEKEKEKEKEWPPQGLEKNASNFFSEAIEKNHVSIFLSKTDVL